jgi:hypothetical protein
MDPLIAMLPAQEFFSWDYRVIKHSSSLSFEKIISQYEDALLRLGFNNSLTSSSEPDTFTICRSHMQPRNVVIKLNTTRLINNDL